MTRRVRLFSRFEILWHWSQALLFIAMLVTGFELHGSYALLGYGPAAMVHVACAAALIVIWIFALFWHVTTGEWRQYVPTTDKLQDMIRFYTGGIFRGEPHPFRPTRRRKHNPIQLVAYLVFNVVISPAIWISGLLYVGFAMLGDVPGVPLTLVALVHTAAAYAVAIFLVGHVYMITTGETVFQHLKAMLTGYERVREPEAREQEG
jgi:thiosulfate reductase cytochrome b subunit